MIVEMTEAEFKRLVSVISFFQGYFETRHPESDVREEVEKGIATIKEITDRGFTVMPPIAISERDIKECTAMAGEALAWMDEKNWTNEDKVSVAAGIFPVLLARLFTNKEKFEKGVDFFLSLIRKSSDFVWAYRDKK